MWFKKIKNHREEKQDSKDSVLSEREIQKRLYGGFRSEAESVMKAGVKHQSLASSIRPVNKGANLFGQKIVEDPKSALISKTVLKEYKPSEEPQGVDSLFENEENFGVKPNLEKRLKVSRNGVSGKTFPQKDALEALDRPNLWLEWNEWLGRFKNISLWHVITFLALLVGAIVLFNVFVNLISERRPSKEEIMFTDQKQIPADLKVGEPARHADQPVIDSANVPSAGLQTSDESEPVADKTPSRLDAATSGVSRPYHVVQVCIYESEKGARELVKELQEEGYPHVRYEPMLTGTGRKLYRVYCGQFVTFREAEEGLRGFEKLGLLKRFPDGFIRQVK